MSKRRTHKNWNKNLTNWKLIPNSLTVWERQQQKQSAENRDSIKVIKYTHTHTPLDGLGKINCFRREKTNSFFLFVIYFNAMMKRKRVSKFKWEPLRFFLYMQEHEFYGEKAARRKTNESEMERNNGKIK